MSKVFHASIEGAQHGSKGLGGFLDFAQISGAAGAQPSNFMLESKEGGFMSAAAILDSFEMRKLKFDGISIHCPTWVLCSAWTGTRSIRPFIPAHVARMSPVDIEHWAEDYILGVMDLAAELGVRMLPMFWGLSYGLEVASGYPWGFWSGAGFDLIKEGNERFLNQTKHIRARANSLGIAFAHEIHPGTAATCAYDFMHLLDLTDFDECMRVNADPSHCWEGEGWQDRFKKVGQCIVGVHMKNHVITPGMPVRSMEPSWAKRGMKFSPLNRGNIDLVEYAELMQTVGYPARYRVINNLPNDATVPLVVEAEAAITNGDKVSADGIRWVEKHCCVEVQKGSFEDAMGAAK